MRAYQIVLVVIAVVAVNNMVLLKLMGYFDEPLDSQDDHAVSAIELAQAPSEESEKTQKDRVSSPVSNVIENEKPEGTTVLSSEISNEIRSFVASDEFSKFFDEYQIKLSNRYIDFEKKYSRMSGLELLEAILESDNALEKQMAIQLMVRGKMGELSVQELKTLYLESSEEDWDRVKVLSHLLEEGDQEAIEWAKDALRDNTIGIYVDSEIYMSLYEKAPEFMTRYVNDIDVDNGVTTYGVMSFINSQDKLGKLFYQNNLDKILESDDRQLSQLGAYNTKIEMTDAQQIKLAGLLESKYRDKRNFALGLLSSIENTDTLRDAYQKLERPQEKYQFIQTLLTRRNGGTSEQRDLARELAKESDDPKVLPLLSNN